MRVLGGWRASYWDVESEAVRSHLARRFLSSFVYISRVQECLEGFNCPSME
jgi:hypothetical protein